MNASWIKVYLGMVLSFSIGIVNAGSPLWTFTPLTATTVSVLPSQSSTVQYQITNQSQKTHTLQMSPIQGITQVTTAGNCSSPFTLAYKQSCTLTLQVNGNLLQGNVNGGPDVCESTSRLQCYRPSQADVLNITLNLEPYLSTSLTSLVLKASGAARLVTITNNGTKTAENVTYMPTPSLPAGTTIAPATCGSIPPGGVCQLVITPGATPTAPPASINTPVILNISGTNTNAVSTSLSVLTYGSIYQSGYVFSLNDTVPNTQSAPGKVLSLVNQAPQFPNGIIWSSDANGVAVFDDIPGIYETSIAPPCNANVDGHCSSQVIINYYSPPQTTPAINFSLYAAGLCKATIGGFNDWFLPSICEFGYDTNNNGTGCGTQIAPTIDNVQSNLVENGNIGSLSGLIFWSSNEFFAGAGSLSWVQVLDTGVTNRQVIETKNILLGVRCARAFT